MIQNVLAWIFRRRQLVRRSPGPWTCSDCGVFSKFSYWDREGEYVVAKTGFDDGG